MSKITKYKLNVLLILISTVCSVVFLYFVWVLQVIPVKYRIIISGITILINSIWWLFFYLANKTLTRNLVRILITINSILLLLLSFMAYFGWDRVNTTLENIVHNAVKTKETVYVYVKRGSEYKTLADLDQKKIGLIESGLVKNQRYAMNEIKKEIQIESYFNQDIYKIIDELQEDNCDAILIDEGYLSFVPEVYKNFEKNYRMIHQITWYEESTIRPSAEITSHAFNVYISGIDTYGSANQKSRSDVNMIVSINPQTKQILLVTTPRDYYVESACLQNQRDKLTHSGMYGVDCSINTLENLYDIELDYYVRMNFTGMQTIIDALGGVEVEVKKSFCLDGICLEQGKQKLNGKQALMFARERHSLPNGDFDRAKNQQQVIKAIFDNMMSVSMLQNFESILSSVGKSLQTNMPKEDILKLVTMQMEDMVSWNIDNISAEGENDFQTTASIGDLSLFVVIPDQDSINEIKIKIQKIHQGILLEE